MLLCIDKIEIAHISLTFGPNFLLELIKITKISNLLIYWLSQYDVTKILVPYFISY